MTLTPSSIFLITLSSAAGLAWIITFVIKRKYPIANPIFSLARFLASFVLIWLLWGSLSSQGESAETLYTSSYQIGAFKYLFVQLTQERGQAWQLSNWNLDVFVLSLTAVLSVLASLGLSFILRHLSKISDRQI